jgi:hypothetical protein
VITPDYLRILNAANAQIAANVRIEAAERAHLEMSVIADAALVRANAAEIENEALRVRIAELEARIAELDMAVDEAALPWNQGGAL